MTTVNKNKVQNDKNIEELITALYCRLSVEDIKDEDGKKKKKDKEDESNSISNQKQILLDYCKKHGYTNTMFFVDDGISGTRFDRNDFNRMQRMVEEGKICRIIVKDLSRFGREQVEAGRLTQIVYPSLGVTFISIQENINSSTGEGMEMLPFYNIFNEWYAAQTSKKIRAVWQSKADNGTMRQQERKRLERVIERGTRRISEIDKLIEAAFERNVLGKLEDDRYERMVKNYAQEQRELIAEVQESKVVLQKAEQQVVDLRLLLRTLRELTEVKELTPTLVNSLIERIEIHNNDKSGGHCYVKVDIYFTAAGMIDIPTEEEILAMMEEIRENPQEFRYVA